VFRGPNGSGLSFLCRNSPERRVRRALCQMRKGSNSSPKRESPSSPRREKRILSAVGIANPYAAPAKSPKCIATAGEIFPDATIDLVADASDSYRLNLLHWDGSSATVAPRIEHGRATYEPIALEPSLVNAVQWPKNPLEYGSTIDLFGNVLGLITRHAEIQDASARLVAYFVFSTWFPDRLSLAPCLAIVGPGDSEGIQLLRLLRCLCRRSMLLAEASQSSLLSLPLQLSPTLLMNRPMLSRPLRSFLSTSNRRGLGTVKRGKVLEVCCPKAVYFGMDEIPQDIASITMQIPLSSATAPKNVLEDGALNKITAELQGKMLAYRLANYSRIRVALIPGMNFTHQTREIAMNLAACIVDDVELAGRVVPLLREQDDHVREQPDRKLEEAILGAVLACLHEKKSDRVQVKEIAALANALLRTQGEIVEYRPEEVGHRLDGFSLGRTRQNEGMFLLLSRDTSRLVHRLALGYGVSWDANYLPDCPDCKLLRSRASLALV
jgi:hypothetical protein